MNGSPDCEIEDPCSMWAKLRHEQADDRVCDEVLRAWLGKGKKVLFPVVFNACTKLALLITMEGWRACHAVAFGAKLNRARLISPFPCSSTLAKFRKYPCMQPVEEAGGGLPTRCGDNPFGGMRANAIYDWVVATSYIKNLKEADEAACAWSRVLLHERHDTISELLDPQDIASRERLRTARVRLDCTAMLCFRFALGMMAKPVFYVWADSSPQWMGPGIFRRILRYFFCRCASEALVPMCCFATRTGLSNAQGVCLVVADLLKCRRCASSAVLSQHSCSDRRSRDRAASGPHADWAPAELLPAHQVEHLCLPGQPVCIFVRSGSARMAPLVGLAPAKRPLAISIFPAFIQKIKAVVGWLREDEDAITEHLRKRQLHGLASIVSDQSLPTFANWRWSTLNNCLVALSAIAASLAQPFDAGSLKKCRDTKKVKLVTDALSSKEFFCQLHAVTWYCGRITDILEWGGGCECHGRGSTAAERAACMLKGRRMHHAYKHASESLESALAEVRQWDDGQAGGDTNLLRQTQAVVKGTWHAGMEKLAFLNDIPYLLCRLDQDGVRDRCLEQYDAGGRLAGDPVSDEFLADGSSMRQHVIDMSADGTGMHPELARAVASLQMIPIDDVAGEAPHARMKHVSSRTRAATWGWQASTDRLRQNCRDLEQLLPVLQPATDYQWLWDRWSAVLQPKVGALSLRPVRLPRSEVEDRVYTMRQFRDFKLQDMAADPQFDEDDAPDDKPDGEPDEHDDAEDCDALGDGWGRLLRDFYESAFAGRVGAYFSICSSAGEHRVFQLLAFKQGLSLVKTFRARQAFACKVTVAWQEIWATRGRGAHMIALDIFELENPASMDLADFVKNAQDRDSLYAWTEQPSDTEGCVCLAMPQIVQSQTKLNAKKVPVLSLMDGLLSAGFSLVERKVTHTSDDTVLEVDGRKPATRRAYFQCVLARQEIFGRGTVTEFASDRSQAWYALLLHDRLQGLTKQNMQKRLKEVEDEIDVASLNKRARVPAPADCDEIAQDLPAELLPVVASPRPASPPASSKTTSRSSSSNRSSSSSSNDVAADVEIGGYAIPKYIGGMKVSIEAHAGKPDSRGLRIRCPHHARCRRFANLAKDPFSFGPACAHIFSGVWLGVPAPTRQAHKDIRPSRAQQQEYAEPQGLI